MSAWRSVSHVVQQGETPEMLARRYGLTAVGMITESPRNPRLGGWQPARPLTTGSVVHIPANPARLLQERFAALQGVNALLRDQFHAHRGRLDAVLDELTADPLLSDAALGIVRELTALVVEQQRAAALASRQLGEINSGLRDCGLVGKDLIRWPDDPAALGLPWMLTPALLDLWSTMWEPDGWQGAYPELDSTAVAGKVQLHLNLVGSKILQQGELRIRETVQEMRSVQAPGGA